MIATRLIYASQIGDLLRIAITIPPRDVERLLDSLANLQFPINPDLKYEEWQTTVEFPGYREWLPDLRGMLARDRFDDARLQHSPGVEN
jgi:hypothetical protein